MARQTSVVPRWLAAACVTGLAGCNSTTPPPTTTAPPPTPTPTPVATATPSTAPAATNPAAAAPQAVRVGPLRMVVPGDWALQCLSGTGATKVRAVAPSGAIGGTAVLTVDVPPLGFHVPGLIPIGMVADGYADDVRQHEMADAAGPPAAAMSVTDAKARRVTRTGHAADGRPMLDDAVVLVHGDAVYIVSVTADAAAGPAATAALDAAVASIRWAP